jgi:hypothetical protein
VLFLTESLFPKKSNALIPGTSHLYVVGTTSSDDQANGDQFPTNPAIGQANRLQHFNQAPGVPPNHNADAFLAQLDPTANPATSIVSLSYIGGGGQDNGLGLAVDTKTNPKNAWVVGITYSTDFRPPVMNLPGLQQVAGGNGDGFVVSVAP